ncbi:MAG: alpha/beta hydrolase fold domain-containing protein [Chitinophagaceae bacterium]
MNKFYPILFAFALLISHTSFAQKWVDTSYAVVKMDNIKYGNATDFAGAQRDLTMNIAMPLGDTAPPCGRPLFVAIHGGSFMAGSKDADLPPRWIIDFAKRGYVAISINYRLGLFQTSSSAHCNITNLGVPWDCLNVADTAEWTRAMYRGMQDAKGAIRYMVNHATDYNFDPRNVFVAGESAGAFIALATGFLDDSTEKPSQCAALSAVPSPNAIYENACITSMNLGTSISAFNLNRPDLGSINGDLNPTTIPYTIRGVGSFYGAIFQDLFLKTTAKMQPVLYLFHQPNDLLVPYTNDALFAGFAYCATQFPANCAWIMNRPLVYGGNGINSMIKGLSGTGISLPVVQFDSTSNFSDCAAQLATPALAGHSTDNYWLRSTNMAKLFAGNIDATNHCLPTAVKALTTISNLSIAPNPARDELQIICGDLTGNFPVVISNMLGQTVYSGQCQFSNGNARLLLKNLTPATYILTTMTEKYGLSRSRFLVQ